jgi:hypothetical protein
MNNRTPVAYAYPLMNTSMERPESLKYSINEEKMIAPAPKPPTARPVTNPFRFGNHFILTESGQTYPNAIPDPEIIPIVNKRIGNEPLEKEDKKYPAIYKNEPIPAVTFGPFMFNRCPV